MSETVATAESQPSQNHNNTFLIILLIAVFVIGSGGFILMQKRNSNNNGSSQNPIALQEQKILNTPVAPYDLIYGTWNSDSSVINSLDLNSGIVKTIAVLPSNIKKVTPLAPNTLLFVDKTDINDHGTKLTAYNFTDGTSQTSVKAAGGYGIDDYVLSPNKQYISTWEVALAPGSSQLKDGRSRVYTATLSNPSQKNLIYDEPASNPVHYPIAIANDGKVLTDKFQPNDPNGGAGWAYGMSVSDFTGKQKSDLAQMQNGTYGTQPKVSPDGQSLVFAGYDGIHGAGTKINKGYRQAVLSPDTIETLNITTLQRTKLANLPNTNSYTFADWNPIGNTISFNEISKVANVTGLYTYNLATKVATKLDPAASGGDQPSMIATFPNNKQLLGTTDNSSSSVGNLGDHYSSSFTQFLVREPNSKTDTNLSIPDAFMQYISVLPNNALSDNIYGTKAPATKSAQNANPVPNYPVTLKTFFLKAALADTRACNQTGSQSGTPTPSGAVSAAPGAPSAAVSTAPAVKNVKGLSTQKKFLAQAVSAAPSSANPSLSLSTTPGASAGAQCQQQRCRDIVGPQCQDQGLQIGTDAYSQCLQNGIKTNREAGVCFDSPLYVYGQQGQQIQVKVNTPIVPSDAAYTDAYNILVTKDNKLSVNGSLLDSISYDYNPGLRKVAMPTKGYVTSKNDLEATLHIFAKGMGLNAQETADLVTYGKNKIAAPYVYVSYYDQKTSEHILPLSFSPQPDNYLNVVFYFKPLAYNPAITPIAPTFANPVKRNGLTVVEVSEYLDN